MCSCGKNYHKDVFGIDAVNMYPFYRWNEIYVSKNGTNFVKECMQEYMLLPMFGIVYIIGRMQMPKSD